MKTIHCKSLDFNRQCPSASAVYSLYGITRIRY